MTRRTDASNSRKLPPPNIDLIHSTPDGGPFPWGIVVGVMILAFCLAAAMAYLVPSQRPTCPDGYALSGGGWGGRLVCVEGVAPTFVPR